MAFASKKPLLLQRVKRVLGVAPKSTRIFGNVPVTILFFAALIGVSVYAVGQNTVKKKKAKTHQISTKHQRIVSENEEQDNESFEVPEVIVDIPDLEENIDISFDNDMDVSFLSDSLKSKMAEFHLKMESMQKEMEPLQRRMEELHLEMEKQQFEVEHFGRDEEKLDWKKDRANDIRQDLIEKRSTLLHPDSKSKIKLNEADLEKQLAEFEQQIKVQEQAITQLNTEIANSRKEAEKAEEPYKKVEKEMEEISKKMEEVGKRMEIESREIGKLMPAPPKPPRAPKAVSARKATAAIPAPPAPKTPPVSPKSPSVPPAPPVKK